MCRAHCTAATTMVKCIGQRANKDAHQCVRSLLGDAATRQVEAAFLLFGAFGVPLSVCEITTIHQYQYNINQIAHHARKYPNSSRERESNRE